MIADSIVITGTNTAPRYMNITNGTLGTQLASADVASKDLNSVMVNDQFKYNDKHYVVAGPAFTNGKYYVLDVTNPASATLVTELGPVGDNKNLNNTGGIIFDDATGRLYIMDTNNVLLALNISTVITSSNANDQIADKPAVFRLYDNYPNPFNPTTNIMYELPVVADVSIKVYDIQGRMIVNISKGKQKAGSYTHKFDAGGLASGMYFYKIEAGSFIATKKMMLIK